jgi:NADPH-dependent glutamate synthase beta subunit-like oxidoreductase
VASDYRGETRRDIAPPPNGKTAAIVGAGVCGLTTARQLARKGYSVDIYERFPVPGGVMWTGVPEWRLPRDVIAEEVALITDLGVRIHYNMEVGKDIQLSQLAAENDAVVLAAGCQIASELGVEGEHLEGVVSGLQIGRHCRWWIYLDGLRSHRAPPRFRAIGDDLPPNDQRNPGR